MDDENKTQDDQTQETNEEGFVVFDDDGKEYKLPSKPDELIEKLEKAQELEKSIAEKEEELKKYQSKEFNFESLRKKSEAEKEEIMRKWSDKEKAMANEIMSMREEREGERSARMEDTRMQTLRRLAGTDESLQKEILEKAKVFSGDAKTEEEQIRRLEDAYTLLKGSKPQRSVINTYAPMGNYKQPRTTKFTETPEGEQAYKSFFPDSPSNKQ